MTSLLRNKAFLLSLLIVVGLAFQFWTGSRYPALDQKAMMAGTAGLEPLGFDTVLVIKDDDAIYMRVLKGTVNWGKTNQRGMTFGILFAAALLTMISLFKRKSFDGSMANSALGVLIGTPLGVCVNCAAPIAKGLHSSGLRLETTLAAMISSPTLNVIVLAMVFSLFPFYMAVMKVGATLVFLLLLIPLMSKYLFKEEVSLTAQRAIAGASGNEDPKFMALDAPVPEDEEIATWPKAFVWVLKAFPRNLWFIIRTTLPLMVLAGFLGSLAVTVVPMDTLASLFPSGSVLMILAGLAIASLIGVFMPVPITFDVIIVSVLMATGMPVMYAMTLLFTLGIYSVYSYMIVAQTISRKVGVTIWLVIAALGVVTGLIAHEYDQRLMAKQTTFLLESWARLDGMVEYHAPLAPAGEAAADILPGLQSDALVPESVNAIAANGINVALTPHAAPAAGDGKMFQRMAGAELGIGQPYQFSLLRWSQPFSEFGGVASGDVHNDGWVDVVVTSQSGAYLYANTGGQFVQQELDIPGLHDGFVANAALVDIDNDGWLDLFYSTYRNGTYLVYNDQGDFRDENRVRLPNHEKAWVSAAMGFGDIDEDGRLDIVLGNWTLGSVLSRKFLGRDTSRNVVLLNRGTGFEARELPGPDGETLTVLLSDWNGDGHLDLIVGNDFAVPDLYYLGDGAGNMQLVMADDEIIPVTALLTMSATTADINNDLKPEIYIGNVSGTDHSTMLRIPDMCVDTEGTAIHEQCQEVRANQELMNTSLGGNDPLMCVDFGDLELTEQCIGMHLNL
ncbi:MAG: FG-GAP-like repeat-containing protein, partial [Gammaproteobacteria bacterium]|nr:FG-GAP-like repeat-containing protein [Gammaproteobacteria bacterium]